MVRPVASPDGALVAGYSVDPDDRVAFMVDVATGDTIATLRPCELVQAVDAVRLLVLVEAPVCFDESQEAVADEARRGIVDLRTGELVAPLENPRFIAYATLGSPGTIAEDLLVTQTFPDDDDPQREVDFRRFSTGELLASWPFDSAIAGLTVSLSPDGTQASLAAQTGQAVIFDVEAILDGASAKEAATVWEDRTNGPNNQTVPMGDTFVTSGGGTEIRQWDTASGRLVAEVATDPKGPHPSSPSRTGQPSSTPTPTVCSDASSSTSPTSSPSPRRGPARVHGNRVREILPVRRVPDTRL